MGGVDGEGEAGFGGHVQAFAGEGEVADGLVVEAFGAGAGAGAGAVVADVVGAPAGAELLAAGGQLTDQVVQVLVVGVATASCSRPTRSTGTAPRRTG